jgi:hypothetical protein
MMALLRGAGYELEALDNATPLRYGPQTIAGLAEDFSRPLLCANRFAPEMRDGYLTRQRRLGRSISASS